MGDGIEPRTLVWNDLRLRHSLAAVMDLDLGKGRQTIRGGMGLRFVGHEAPRNRVVCFGDGGGSRASGESHVTEAGNHGTYAWRSAIGSGIIGLCRHLLGARSNVDSNAVKCRHSTLNHDLKDKRFDNKYIVVNLHCSCRLLA